MTGMGIAERRARLGLRHHLALQARATSVVEVAGDLVGLHATDPASVFLSAAARLPPDRDVIELVERALYDERAVVRVLGMRRTVFVLPVEVVPIVHAACTRALAVRERQRTVRLLEQAGVAADGAHWLRQVEEATITALRQRGEATAAELSEEVAGLRHQIPFGEGKKWQGRQGVSTRVLFLLAADGLAVRGRPRGSWTSTQYTWAPMESWLASGAPAPGTEVARAELARRWLAGFGPGTLGDLEWWTGWTTTEVRRALAQVRPVEVDLDGATGLVLAHDLAPVPPPEPEAWLLPALDPTVMGWVDRRWYLGEHGPALFDRSGNAGPTVWWDGRVVGGWAQRDDGQIVFRLLEDVGADARAAVAGAAESLGRWLGERRVIPRFRTPLERELST